MNNGDHFRINVAPIHPGYCYKIYDKDSAKYYETEKIYQAITKQFNEMKTSFGKVIPKRPDQA